MSYFQTPLEDLQLLEIKTPELGSTHTGASLEKLCKQIDREVSLSTLEVKKEIGCLCCLS